MSSNNVKVKVNHAENEDYKIYTSLLNKKKCIICKNEKSYLINCNSFYPCSCKLCYSCLQLQLNKYLQPYDIVWQGEDDKEIDIDDNDDIGGLYWSCPTCSNKNVITEDQLINCADIKRSKETALSFIKKN